MCLQASQAIGGLVAVIVLIIVIVALAAGGGEPATVYVPAPAPAPPAGMHDYVAAFSTICETTPDAMALEMVGSYECAPAAPAAAAAAAAALPAAALRSAPCATVLHRRSSASHVS